MLEQYWKIYREEKTQLHEKMTWKKAAIFTLFDSVFIGIKIGTIVAITWLFMTSFWVSMTTEISQKICP